MNEEKIIDIDQVIKSKSVRLYALMPKFIISYLKRITHQELINSILRRNGHLIGVDFTERFINEFGVEVNVVGEHHIIENDRFLVAANHPLGGLDGIAVLNHIGHIKPIKTVANDLLMNVPSLSPLFIPVNKHGKNPRDYVRIMNETFNSDINILYFPAGLVSRKNGKIIKDLEWKKSFLQKAVKSKRMIIPAFISGRNSSFFYNLANFRKFLGIKANIEMLYLVDEMYQHRKTAINIIYGKPIPYTHFDNSKTEEQWAAALREYCYILRDNPDAVF